MNDDEPLSAQLEHMRAEHRRLDGLITDLIAAGSADQIELARLKKQKLRLKDQIERISDINTPDIIA